MIAAKLADALLSSLGSTVREGRPLSGGDINDAYAVTLADGRRVFVKTNTNAPKNMFAAEARGLAWLTDANAVRIPRVLAVSAEDDACAFLALELIEPASKKRDFDEHLGRALSALHRTGAPSFGLDHDNFIGRLAQSNETKPDWATFYRDCRLLPQIRMASDRGRLERNTLRALDALMERLPVLVGASEPPARLHGDLWGGNLHVDDTGAPCLIDPAVYGGHREIDLAMMRLFGGFGPRVFGAYEEAFPLSEEHEERVPLYQLYPLLVHVNLFGGGYAASVHRAASEYV